MKTESVEMSCECEIEYAASKQNAYFGHMGVGVAWAGFCVDL